MKKHITLSFKRYSMILGALFITAAANAQYGNTGMRFSEYGGSMSTYENPAFGASSKTKWDVHLFNINEIMENDAIKLKWSSLVSDGNIDLYEGGTSNQQNISFRNVLEINGPAAFYNYKKKYAFGINTRARFFFQMQDVNRRLANAFMSDADFNLSTYGPIMIDFANLNTQILTDIGITGSAEVLKIKNHTLYAGASLRFYQGNAALNVTAENINVDPDKIISGDSVVQFSTNLQLHSAMPDGFNMLGGSSDDNSFSGAFGKSAGSGVGADIGAVYKGTLLGKSVRGSLSITDIGKINYKNGELNSGKFIANNVTIPVDSFRNFPSGYDSIKQWAAQYGVVVDSGAETFSQSLPTRLNLYAEAHIIKKLYVGLATTANLAGKGSFRSSYASSTTLILRWQTKMIDVWMPISYNYFTNSVTAGLGARLAYVYFGTDNIGSLISGEGKSFNIYFGLRVAGAYKN